MPVTPFKAMSFVKDDVVTKDSLDQMQANYQWINDNTPRGRFYRGNGEPLDVRTLVVSGRARIRKNKKDDTGKARVRFRKAFAPNCHPHVTTGIVSDFQRRIFCVVNGPGGVNYPNANGFEIKVNIAAEKKKNDKIQKEFWIHWHAFGYRTDDMNEF